MMKLQFDPNQDYQKNAIEAVTRIFEGQENGTDSVRYRQNGISGSLIGSIPNVLDLDENQILKNLQEVQKTNSITPVSEKLEGMNFTVEMETGTGKTYVYLRTIYELYNEYGFKKFIIVVPSIAIREGVLKNLEITREHFQNIYDKIPMNYYVYDSKRVSALRGFATNNNLEILVINIDSFAKDENIINKYNDRLSGHKPIEFIQSVSPVVIVDEPQNMETDIRKKAIENLNPLCTLRYSATHKNLYNLVYSLNPVKAYDLGLVKQIEVNSVIAENDFNQAYIAIESVSQKKKSVSAKIQIDYNDKNNVSRKSFTVTFKEGEDTETRLKNADLYQLSNERSSYKEGFVIEEIDVVNETVTFTNGIKLGRGQSQGGLNDQLMKFQIEKTIEEHLKKEIILLPKGIKVLTLFFIDRVSNYRDYDAAGNEISGKFAQWFEESYNKLIQKPVYSSLARNDVKEIHNGYFSSDNKGRSKDTNGQTQADDDTYSLIMKDKERLLDLATPLRFIFSHSALREGWDSPNVFQICTLNETKSEMKKRQEIGRGLRLAVDQSGQRIFDKNINRLTVVANESYHDFASSLQKEIEEECGVSFSGRIKDATKKEKVTYRKGFEVDPKFLDIWKRIEHKTIYRVNYDSEQLIAASAAEVAKMPVVTTPSIRSTKVVLKFSSSGVDPVYRSDSKEKFQGYILIPDVLAYIQSKTDLTRKTIYEIILQSGRIQEILVNPQLFMDQAILAINHVLQVMMIDGIEYTKIKGAKYEMTLFDDSELEAYLDDLLFKLTDNKKTIYEKFIPLDSEVETQFARDCESSENVEFYFKLPFWFKIPTPIGTYNPDWAVVFQNEKKVYFVTETKSTKDLTKLRRDEQLKIKCGKKHYEGFEDVEYRHVTSLSELV